MKDLIDYISKDDWFRDCFAVKGGTCLTKCYLGYYRFSEDIDFTYIWKSSLVLAKRSLEEYFPKKLPNLCRFFTIYAKNWALTLKKHKSTNSTGCIIRKYFI